MLKRMARAIVTRASVWVAKEISQDLVTRAYARELHPNTLLLRRAQVESADYIAAHMPRALSFFGRRELLRFAASKVSTAGHYLEFGVASGESIRWMARLTGDTVHGFDSFEGLPEDWPGWKHGKGGFSQGGKLPKVPHNVELHAGWFDQTLPPFLASTPGDCAFLHIDCDLYSSTKTVFDLVGPRLRKGSVILFDEYFNYPNWREHEYKAFQEFVARAGLRYEYLAYGRHQVAVLLTEERVG